MAENPPSNETFSREIEEIYRRAGFSLDWYIPITSTFEPHSKEWTIQAAYNICFVADDMLESAPAGQDEESNQAVVDAWVLDMSDYYGDAVKNIVSLAIGTSYRLESETETQRTRSSIIFTNKAWREFNGFEDCNVRLLQSTLYPPYQPIIEWRFNYINSYGEESTTEWSLTPPRVNG
jgi:hypothetical protein